VKKKALTIKAKAKEKKNKQILIAIELLSLLGKNEDINGCLVFIKEI
jgi:hypothetical protein